MSNHHSISYKEVQSVMSNKLDELVRSSAQKMIAEAVELELTEFISRYRHKVTSDGKSAVVRNGYHNERHITVNAGTVKVKVPRTRNRTGGENFHSSIVPRYFKRSLSINSAIPLLYLKGIPTNDMETSLKSLLGNAVDGLSASNVSRLKNIGWKSFANGI